MGKDPAFLFYPSDYMAMTIQLDFTEKGQLIELFCLQFIQGHFTLEAVKRVLKTEVSEVLLSMFIQDEYGNYYNEWLEEKIQKRKAFTKSRAENRINGHNKAKGKNKLK